MKRRVINRTTIAVIQNIHYKILQTKNGKNNGIYNKQNGQKQWTKTKTECA